jgi:Skp family chaperone for outer membrane proteins
VKPTESPAQLLMRFSNRSMELQKKLSELQASYDEYNKVRADLDRLKGAEEAITYLLHGKLPGDGNHNGMKDHKPSA